MTSLLACEGTKLTLGDKFPDFIKHLKSVNYQERMATRDTLCKNAGIPKSKTSEGDTEVEIKTAVDEVQQWWNIRRFW